MDRILTEIVYIVFQVLKVLLIKICKIVLRNKNFYFLLFLLVFTSADIIFHKVLELRSTLSEKKIFVTHFPFLMDSLKPLQPPPTPHPNSQNPLTMTKVFVNATLTYHGFSRLLCYNDARKN